MSNTNLRQGSLVVKSRDLWLRWRSWLHSWVIRSHGWARHVGRRKGRSSVGGLNRHARDHLAVWLGLLNGAHGLRRIEVVVLCGQLVH